MTTKQQIREWLHRGKEQGSDFMAVVCDRHDYSDYPLFLKTEDAAFRKLHEKYGMDLMECYNLHENLEAQLAEQRAHHFPDCNPKLAPRRVVGDGSCPECGGSDLEWMVDCRGRSGVVDGRHCINEIQVSFVLGCTECSETIAAINADRVAEYLTDSKIRIN